MFWGFLICTIYHHRLIIVSSNYMYNIHKYMVIYVISVCVYIYIYTLLMNMCLFHLWKLVILCLILKTLTRYSKVHYPPPFISNHGKCHFFSNNLLYNWEALNCGESLLSYCPPTRLILQVPPWEDICRDSQHLCPNSSPWNPPSMLENIRVQRGPSSNTHLNFVETQ